MSTRFRLLVVATIGVCFLGRTADAGLCPPLPGNGNICSANDLVITDAELIDGPSACTEGELFSAVLAITFGEGSGPTVTLAADRYDIGLFVGDAGGPVFDGPSCSFRSLTPVGEPPDLLGGNGPFRDLDGDLCGDVKKTDVTIVHIALDDILCQDTTGDGEVDLDFVISWENNRNETCSDPTDPEEFFIEQPSKCRIIEDLPGDIIVESPLEINIAKTAVPSVIPTPEGIVIYSVLVQNVSDFSDPILLTELDDDLYGNLDGQGDCTLPQSIPPGGVYYCTFSQAVSGSDGDVVTDVITATATDSEDNSTSDSDSASVTLMDGAPPSIEMTVETFVVPSQLDEPGGSVTYDVVVQNAGQLDIELFELTSAEFGDLDGRGSCLLPQQLPAISGIYQCNYTQVLVGAPGDLVTNPVTAVGEAQGVIVDDSDSTEVVIQDVVSHLDLFAEVDPVFVSEPGGMVEYRARLVNASVTDTIVVDSLVDNLLGDLNGQGDCALPVSLDPNEEYQCAYPVAVSGLPGEVIDNTLVANGLDDDGIPVDAASGVFVQIRDVPSSVTVSKTAIPSSIAAPGGPIEFDITITNTSVTDTITISTLTDDIYGDLDGRGTCITGLSLAPAETLSCSFVENISGSLGQTFTDIVSLSATDDDGDIARAEDTATVTITQGEVNIDVDVTPLPASINEPGGDIDYQVTATNTGDIDLTLESLDDSVFGNLNGQGSCATPTPLPVGATYTCDFLQLIEGQPGTSVTNTITALGDAGPDGSDTDTDSATVTITDIPASMQVTKNASPENLPAPGGLVTFSFKIVNTSSVDEITIDSMIDDIHGDLDGQGTCSTPQVLGPGSEYLCSFDIDFPGSIGDSETDIVTVDATDDDGFSLQESDTATVTITQGDVALGIIMAPNPSQIPEPGQDVLYTLGVRNTGEIDLTLTDLDDSTGSLDGHGTCVLPQDLAAGEIYICAFPRPVSGVPDDVVVNTATAIGDAGIDGSATASTSTEVTILDVPSSINITKVASPAEVPPSTVVTFSLDINNTSTVDEVTLTSLVDVPYGDLHGQGTCSMPQVLPAGGSYQCEFTQLLDGSLGDELTDIVTVDAIDDDGNALQDSDDATVLLGLGQVSIDVANIVTPESVDEPGGDLTYTVNVVNTGSLPYQVLTLVDSAHGDLSSVCPLPVTLAPTEVLTCDHLQSVTGQPGDAIISTVTATTDAVIEGMDSAIAVITDRPSSLSVSYSASPEAFPAPSRTVSYLVAVENTSAVDTVTVHSLSDEVGDLDQGDCTVPQTLAPLGVYLCTFDRDISGSNGDLITRTATADGTDDDGQPVSGSDPATVMITPGEILLDVAAAVIPSDVPEPGSVVTYQVVVGNTGLIPFEITSLSDSLYGDLDGQGICTLPQSVSPGETYGCAHSQPISGPPMTVVSTLVTAVGDAGVDGSAVASDSTEARITDVPSSINVTYTVNPNNRPAPGGEFDYELRVENTSEIDTVTIDALIDDVWGDLVGQGTCVAGVALDPSEEYACTHTQSFTGSLGDETTSTASVDATDDDGASVADADNATISLTQGLVDLGVVYQVAPNLIPEPGESATYSLTVTNTGDIPLTVTSLVDDVYGDLGSLGCSTPFALAVDESFDCSHDQDLFGQPGDDFSSTVTAIGDAGVDGQVVATDDASAEITNLLPLLEVIKTAPHFIEEPGEQVTFTVSVTNRSVADVVTIETLTDDIHGDLNGQGSCSVPQVLAPTETYPCQFEAFVAGLVNQDETDTITAEGTDDDGQSVSAFDSATVEILEAPPKIEVRKTPSSSISYPGGPVTFSIEVTNTSFRGEVEVIDLTDSVFGGLNGRGTCSVPQLVELDDTYSCEFVEIVDGELNSLHVNYVVAIATRPPAPGSNPHITSDLDFALVLLAERPPNPVEIPTLSTSALVLLSLALIGTAVSHLRRRRKS